MIFNNEDERQEYIEELTTDLQDALEAYNENYYLDPEGDYAADMAGLMAHEFTGQNLKQCLINYQEHWNTPEDARVDYLLTLTDDQLEKVADMLWRQEGYEITVEHALSSPKPMVIASVEYGEQEEGLAYWLDHMQIEDEYRAEVVAELTGDSDSEYYYFNNEYQYVALAIDLDQAEYLGRYAIYHPASNVA